MSEPIKKPNRRNPESYTPKKPEILSMVKNALKNEQCLTLPPECVIKPKDKIATFSGEKWPFSNVEPAVYSALGLLFGRTERRDDAGALVNDDIEYAIHNVLTGHAFGLFYCLPDDSLSMAAYGFTSYRLEMGDYSEDEIVTIIKDQIYRGNAVHIDEGNGPFDTLIWGYKDNGSVLLGYKFEHGNDMLNCSYDLDNPIEFDSLTKCFSDSALFKTNGEKPGGIALYQPDGERLNRDVIYKKALAEGYRMLTQTEPLPVMDFERVHFGYGKAIYDEWIRQIEQAETENREEFFDTSPIFPHLLALYENRLQILRFLKFWNEQIEDEHLFKAIELCEKFKSISSDAATVSVAVDWNPLKDAPNHEKRVFLLDALKKCYALELEIAEQIKKFIDSPESYNPKKPEIIGMAKQVCNTQLEFPPIFSFNGENGIYEMPPTRFIGIRHNHMPGKNGRKQLGNFLSSTFGSKTWNDVVLSLPNVINNEACDFTCEYVAETDSFSFIVGVFSPAKTPVPEGLDYREVPATLVWVWQKENGKDALNELNKLSNDEYTANFDAPGFPWQAFLRADTYAVLPIKMKEKQSPESYNPKKPEIVSMMKENAGKIEMNKAYEVRTANSGSYIDDVPILRWGEWRDNTYCGCVTALLNAAGIPASYEEVMGLSGVCYKAIMRYDWDPSSEVPQNGLMCEKNVGDVFGISVYTLQEEKDVWRQAKISIDNGFLILLLGGRFDGEWSLACGYAIENGEDKFFGRTYWDYKVDSVPQNEIYTENRYFYSDGFPGWYPGALTRFYDKKCDPISRKQALKISLETCIKMFEQPPGEHHIFGYDAYDVLISGFELDDAEYQEKCRNDQYHIGSLQDARRAAYVYLDASAELLDGNNKVKLMEAAGLYKNMLDNLLAAVPYKKTSSVFNGSSDPVWNKKQRSELVSALRENKKLEVQARVIIAEILENWED